MTPSELIEETDFLRKWNRLSAQVHVDDYADAVQSLATQLDDAKQVIVTLRATMEQMRRERDEARALAFAMRDLDECAARLDCEATEVVDSVQSALDRVRDAEYASRSLREYVDANAASVQEAWGILGCTAPLVECARRTVAERDEARAKLAQVTDVLRKVRVPTEYEWSSLPETAIRRVLRIIDEKEGGQ